MRRALFIPALLAAALLAAPAAAAPGWFGGAIEAPDKNGDAAFAASEVSIPGRISGDAMILAGKARLDGEVGDDVRVVAGRYKQAGSVGGELAVAAQHADIDGSVGDDLYLAADDARLGPEARIGQDARIYGKEILIKGRIDRNLDVSGEVVALSAQVGGNVTIHARSIVLGPGATIEGRLLWYAPAAPEIPTDAIIRDGVKGQISNAWRREGVLSWAMPFHGATARAAMFAGEAAARLMVALSAFAIGLLLILATPHYADRVFETVRTRWGAALVWGLIILSATPILAVVMMLTIVGIPLGFMMVLSLPIMALIGYAAGAGGVGALAFRAQRSGQRMLALAAGLVGLTLLWLAPGVGWLFSLLATMLGLGALAVALRPRRIMAS